MDWYALSRKIFNYAFEHKECGVYHISIFMWIVELNNRLWWKKEFWLPSNDSCEWLSIGNKNTYLSALRDLEKWWFIKIIQESRNQFCSTIIQICHVKSDTATNTALDTALIRQDTQHWYAIDTIDKQRNQETKKPRNISSKEETTALDVPEEFWKKEINQIIDTIKQTLNSIGLIYKAWPQERQRAQNILTGKEFWEICDKSNMSREQFVISIIKLSSKLDFWNWKIYNCQTFYKHYARVYNEARRIKQEKEQKVSHKSF